MKRSVLVTLADKNYIEQAKQLFSSAYWNGGWKGDFLLLSVDVPEEDLKSFIDNGIIVKRCKKLDGIKGNEWANATLNKFHLFTPGLKKWKNIVFIDVDVIVRADINELAGSKKFCAVLDKWERIDKQIVPGKQKEFQRRFKKKVLHYAAFNSGVMAFDSKAIKKNTFSQLASLAEEYMDYSYTGEQLILNLYFLDKWDSLPSAYNFNPLHMINPFLKKTIPDIGIIWHFPGVKKPWICDNEEIKRAWGNNMERFGNFSQSRLNIKRFSKREIIHNSAYIDIKFSHNAPLRYIDQEIGAFGLILKKRVPFFYFPLKKLFHKLI